jgi:hypothetical protein
VHAGRGACLCYADCLVSSTTVLDRRPSRASYAYWWWFTSCEGANG